MRGALNATLASKQSSEAAQILAFRESLMPEWHYHLMHDLYTHVRQFFVGCRLVAARVKPVHKQTVRTPFINHPHGSLQS